jgi:hypothetical protein
MKMMNRDILRLLDTKSKAYNGKVQNLKKGKGNKIQITKRH